MSESARRQTADTKRGRVVALVRTAMIEKKLTQSDLADAADCHEKTIQNLLAGKVVRQQTLFDVCMVLGLDYEAVRDSHGPEATWAGPVGSPDNPDGAGVGGSVAPTYMGAYSRAGVDHYIGSYLTLRPSFSDPRRIIAYRTDVTWDPEWPSLLFVEKNRPDQPFSHRGRLYIPPSSMFIHLVSLTKGAMRMVLVTQLDATGHMRGLITTLHKQRATFQPVSAPIVYRRQDEFAAADLGEIDASCPRFGEYHGLLLEARAEGYTRMVDVAGGPDK